jgi:hypothetical protein
MAGCEERVAMAGEPLGQDVAEAAEFLEQNGVPRFDGNRVVATAHQNTPSSAKSAAPLPL